ncbi:hypothetical protein BDA96_07G233600 [Sorghum bicolor]|uniref:Uncharacterized protein n=1 Tax=Sorghum bicolor TaxID=4558 RepID=A0A921UBQ1_SORBI|nr:hypothetical protein BDA96_07G233600 [Sorghum bicolor]
MACIYRHPSTQPLDTQLIQIHQPPPPASSPRRGDDDDVVVRLRVHNYHHPCSDRSARRAWIGRRATGSARGRGRTGGGEAGAGAGWQRPEGVFDLPWQKCRGGLGVASGGGGWELRDVFFRSLVDGHAAAIGVPGDRLSAPPSKRTLFDDVDAWLASAGDGEVDPLWRSVLEAGPRPAA